MTAVKPDKSLGQHWLKDENLLTKITSYAKMEGETVLEIGPGLGFLTSILLKKAATVIAVEFDRRLADNLVKTIGTARPELASDLSKLKIIKADFLQFDLNQLPKDYQVVANIPYYITNKIIMKLLEADNKPSIAVLLVQKEVAERLAAGPGEMSILSVAAQLYARVELGEIVPAAMFDPSPKVDSQVVILKPYDSISVDVNEKEFFRVVKAGFSQRRKKLRTALADGLNISVTAAEKLLHTAHIDPNCRAQDLSLNDWINLAKMLQ